MNGSGGPLQPYDAAEESPLPSVPAMSGITISLQANTGASEPWPSESVCKPRTEAQPAVPSDVHFSTMEPRA